MRRVCCFCERWESGGIESFLCNVLTRMDLGELEVDIVASSLGESVFTRRLEEHGARFFELSGSQRDVQENHRRFRELLRERRYDVLHLNAFQGLSLAYLRIAKEEGVPVRIAHSHNTALRRSLTRPLKLAMHDWAKGRYTGDATELWACSGDAAAFLFSESELRKRGYTFIPNGIDVERFRFDPAAREETRRELGLEDAFVIGNVGRLCYQKNQSFLLEVLAELLNARPESRLLLVGEGEDRDELMKKAAELDLADKVLFLGNRKDVERLYWAMDVFALPSRFEGLPVTAVEAQAAGRTCFLSASITRESVICPESQVHFILTDGTDSSLKQWTTWLLTASSRQNQRDLNLEDNDFNIGNVSKYIRKKIGGSTE